MREVIASIGMEGRPGGVSGRIAHPLGLLMVTLRDVRRDGGRGGVETEMVVLMRRLPGSRRSTLCVFSYKILNETKV